MNRGSVKRFAGVKGENKRDLPERISADNCVVIENYFIEGDGRFITRQGKTTKYTIATAEIIYGSIYLNADTMLVAWSDATNSYVSKYILSTNTFTLLKTYSGVKNPIFLKSYGDWAFSCNGKEATSSKIQALYPIGRMVNFKTQTANFSVGEVATNADGGTGTIVAQVDTGSTGTLILSNVTGTWGDNKLITTATGSATQDGALYDSYELTNSPKAKILEIIQNNGKSHLLAGCTDGDKAMTIWSHADENTGIPFTDWSIGTQPKVAEANFSLFSNAGEVNSVVFSQGRIFVVHDNGISVFHIESRVVDLVGMVQDIVSDYSFVGRGGYKIISTDYGVFYTGKEGIYQIVVGQTAMNGVNIAEVLQTTEGNIPAIFDDSDIVWDGNKRIYITAREGSEDNNIVFVYDCVFKAFTRITGWNIKRFCNMQGTLYAVESISHNIVQLFDGYNDDGFPIDHKILLKAEDGGDITAIKKTRRIWVKGELSPSSVVKIGLNTWDKKGNATEDKKILYFRGRSTSNKKLGFGERAIGGSHASVATIESDNMGDKTIRVNNLSRWQVSVYSSAEEYHEIHFVEVEFDVRKKIRTNSLSLS